MRFLAWRWVALSALLFLFADGATAQQPAPETTYPPYPDVWGWELPLMRGRDVGWMSLHDKGNGDFTVLYRAIRRDQFGYFTDQYLQNRFDVFADKAANITRANRITSQAIKPLPDGIAQKPFDSGAGFRVKAEFSSKTCQDYDVYYSFLNDKGEIVGTRGIYWIRQPPKTIESCRRGPVVEKVKALFLDFYPLADGTFLGLPDAPFVIRFRPDMTSPFIDLRPDLVIADPALVNEIADRAKSADGAKNYSDELRDYEASQNALYDYLSQLKHEQQEKSR